MDGDRVEQVLQGKITGRKVQFTKTYRGAIEITLTAGEKQLELIRRDRYQVQYSDDFDRDRMCIVGSWVISHWDDSVGFCRHKVGAALSFTGSGKGK